MTTKRTCDKCKRTIKEGYVHLKVNVGGNKYTTVLEYMYDLCPECEERFYMWMNTSPKNE